jgi:hypothetical protein
MRSHASDAFTEVMGRCWMIEGHFLLPHIDHTRLI